MNRWKAFIALLLVACYLPATGHCLLEQAGWLTESDGCCETTTPQSNLPLAPCGSGCCELERSGSVTVSRTPHAAAPRAKARPAVLPNAPATVCLIKFVPADNSPPELSGSWRFQFRTALPPRAPSFVS